MLEAGALDDPEEWYAEGSGRGVQDGEHVYTCGGFMLMYGKTNTILQKKKKRKTRKNKNKQESKPIEMDNTFWQRRKC